MHMLSLSKVAKENILSLVLILTHQIKRMLCITAIPKDRDHQEKEMPMSVALMARSARVVIMKIMCMETPSALQGEKHAIIVRNLDTSRVYV